MRAIKRSIADAREAREREAHEHGARDLRERLDRAARERELHESERVAVDDVATCEHVTREFTTRIDAGASSRAPSHRPEPSSVPTDASPSPRHADIAPLRCEPCPRIIPARRLFDGSLLQQFQCDGRCVRDQRRAREQARARAAHHTPERTASHHAAERTAPHHAAERTASRHELTAQIAITTVLAVLAALWIVLAAREASADSTAARRDTRGAETENHDDDDAIDVAAPPTLDAPFGAPVVAPPIADVLAAAYRTAGLDRDLGRGFVRRSRLAGLVPWLSVRTGRNTSWRDEELDVARGVTIEVRATWRLDRLVFDGRELQVAALEGARRRERRRLAARVIQVYFVWKRAARSVGIQARAAAVAEEAAAELDDLTNGWFTEARHPREDHRP